jgi:mevalonate kinase
MNLFTGSKTFLVGEYSVLFGGGAVLLVTPPFFSLKVENGESHLIGVEDNSPAHNFYKAHDFNGLSIEFCDPHNKSGGFGASSAQFSLLYRLHLQLTLAQKKFQKEFHLASFLTEYRQLATQSEGIAPSGADCVAQYFNHHIYFDSKNNTVEKLYWNFPNLDFAIFSTKYKIHTHLHLRKLAAFDAEDLQKCTIGVKRSFMNNESLDLVKNVQAYFDLLVKEHLMLDNSIELVEKLMKIDGVRAAKGCGALGADTIIVIFEKSKVSPEFLEHRFNEFIGKHQ